MREARLNEAVAPDIVRLKSWAMNPELLCRCDLHRQGVGSTLTKGGHRTHWGHPIRRNIQGAEKTGLAPTAIQSPCSKPHT